MQFNNLLIFLKVYLFLWQQGENKWMVLNPPNFLSDPEGHISAHFPTSPVPIGWTHLIQVN